VVGVKLGHDEQSIENNLEMCVNFEKARDGSRMKIPEGAGVNFESNSLPRKGRGCANVRTQG
jgi:hypothetical protein